MSSQFATSSSSHLVLDALFRDYKDSLDSIERALKLGGEDTIRTKRRMEDELDEILEMEFEDEDFQSNEEKKKYKNELNNLKSKANDLKKELRGEASSVFGSQQPAKTSKQSQIPTTPTKGKVKVPENLNLNLDRQKKKKAESPKRSPISFIESPNQNLEDVPGVTFVTKQAKKGDVKELDDVIDLAEGNTRILERMKGRSEETVHIATDIAVTLKQQTEQLQQIQREVDKLGTGVSRARKELVKFTLRMGCDKVLLALIVLMVLTAILIFVTYLLVRLICPNCLNIDWKNLLSQ